MNLPTIKLSEDWEKFFRDKGQFIQPLDTIHDPEQLEVFKIWGQGVWNAMQDQRKIDIQAEIDAEIENQKEHAEADMKKLKTSVLSALKVASALCE